MKIFFLRYFLICALIYSVQSKACSAFLLTGKNYNVVGFNENLKTMPRMIVINKRDIQKRNISWQNLTTDQLQADKRWTSKFGSVTFNLLGYDLPCYGVNEKVFFWLNYIWKRPVKYIIRNSLICSGHNGYSISWILQNGKRSVRSSQ